MVRLNDRYRTDKIMIDIGVGVSLEKNEIAASEEAVRQAKSRKASKEKIDLVLTFSTADFSSVALIKHLNTFLGDVPIFGSNSSALITEKGIFNHGLVVMLIGFPEGVYFNTAYTKTNEFATSTAAGEDLGEKLLYGFQNVSRTLSFLLFDRMEESGAQFMTGLQSKLGRSFPCIGASISNPALAGRDSLFFNTTILNNACIGILWGGKFNFGLGLKHGWKPLGKPHTITQAYDNIIVSIDDQPAIGIYEEYLNYDISRLKKEFKKLSILYPFGMRVPGQQEYLLRNVTSIGDDGSLVCRGNVQTGSSVRLMISTKETCLEATREALNEAKTHLASQSYRFHKNDSSKMAIIFNSFPRAVSLRREIKKELELIRETLDPETPIIGVYTHGELAPLLSTSYHGQAYFQNQTISILIIEA
ncbi:MAG TPA: FIST N-terminal domain-containing protein [Candidatus Omnitrophota bacterium]|nr:FIST N-terminal domain-containing protein [Candidatus Omnitrophota bacterium]